MYKTVKTVKTVKTIKTVKTVKRNKGVGVNRGRVGLIAGG